MQFDRTFTMTPVRPVKHAQAQLDERAVHADELVFESELLARADGPAFVQQLKKEPLIELPRTVCVSIRKRRAFGFALQSQMLELAFTTFEAVGDLTQ